MAQYDWTKAANTGRLRDIPAIRPSSRAGTMRKPWPVSLSFTYYPNEIARINRTRYGIHSENSRNGSRDSANRDRPIVLMVFRSLPRVLSDQPIESRVFGAGTETQ